MSDSLLRFITYIITITFLGVSGQVFANKNLDAANRAAIEHHKIFAERTKKEQAKKQKKLDRKQRNRMSKWPDRKQRLFMRGKNQVLYKSQPKSKNPTRAKENLIAAQVLQLEKLLSNKNLSDAEKFNVLTKISYLKSQQALISQAKKKADSSKANKKR